MKVAPVALVLAILCFALSAAEALRGEASGQRCGSDNGPRIVKKILNVDLAVEQSDPPNLVVTATGQVPTAGYGNVRLVRANYAAPPEDGIQDYFLLAAAPPTRAAEALSEVQASDKWANYAKAAPWLKGIRVHGIDDSVIVRAVPQ